MIHWATEGKLFFEPKCTWQLLQTLLKWFEEIVRCPLCTKQFNFEGIQCISEKKKKVMQRMLKWPWDPGSVWFLSIWFSFNIENWKSKLHNRDFQCLIPQKLKIKNLQSQFSIFVAKKGKIKHHSSIFWKSKTKNWKWPVSGFNFLFSISSSLDSCLLRSSN